MISSSQRPLPDNTRHSQQTNIHAPGGIRTQDLSRRAALPLRVKESHCLTAPIVPGSSHCRGTTITLVRLLWTSVKPRRRDFYLTIHNDQKRDIQPSLRRDSNPQSHKAKRAAADPRLRTCGHWDLHCLRTHAVKNLLYAPNMLQKDKVVLI